MATDNAETLGKILSLLQGVEDSGKATGVSSEGVIKDGKSAGVGGSLTSSISKLFGKEKKLSGTLTAVEKTRYKAIFTILKDVLLPKSEADSLKGVRGAQIVKPEKIEEATKDKKGSGLAQALLGMLGGVGLLAAKIAAIVAGIGLAVKAFDELGPALQALIKTVPKAIGMLFKSPKLVQMMDSLRNIPKLISNFFKNNKLITSFMDGLSGAKGSKIVKLAGKAGSSFMSVLKGLVKGIGGPLLKSLKFVPFLGSLVSFGFAIARFLKGDYIPAAFELISGIANLIPGGQIASMLIDGGLLLYDIHAAREKKQEDAGKEKVGFLTNIKNAISETLLPKLPYIPVIGGFIKFGEAIGFFIDKQWGDGFKMMAQGLVALVGGQGLVNVLSGMSFLSNILTISKEPETVAELDPEGGFDLFGKIGEAVSDIFKGVFNWVKGLIGAIPEKLKGFVSKIPGLGKVAGKIGDFAAGMLPDFGGGDSAPGEITPQERKDIDARTKKAQAAFDLKKDNKALRAQFAGDDGILDDDERAQLMDAQRQKKGLPPLNRKAKATPNNNQVETELSQINLQQLDVLNIISAKISELILVQSKSNAGDGGTSQSTLSREFDPNFYGGAGAGAV